MGTTFKDLCLDAVDPNRMAAFWGPALGLEIEDRGGNVRLADGVDEHAVWVNRVPEAKTVKHRLHLDLHVRAVDDLVALGATVLDDQSFAWTVLADPEGGEFCAFVREDPPTYRLYELCVDAADPHAIARWWADRLNTTVQSAPEHDFVWLPASAGLPWTVIFDRVPESKQVKNRLHLDVWGEPDELIAAGATLLRARDDEIDWHVLADPEGNEFCVFFPGR